MLFFAAWNGVSFYFGRYLDHYGWAMCLAQTITTCTLAIYCVCAFWYMCFFFVVFYPPGVSIALHFFLVCTNRKSYFSSLCFLHVVYFTEISFHSLFYKIYSQLFGWCLRGNIEVETKRRVKMFLRGRLPLLLLQKK